MVSSPPLETTRKVSLLRNRNGGDQIEISRQPRDCGARPVSGGREPDDATGKHAKVSRRVFSRPRGAERFAGSKERSRWPGSWAGGSGTEARFGDPRRKERR